MIELLTQTLHKILAGLEHDDPRGTGWEKLRETGLLTPFQQGLEVWSDATQLIRVASVHAPGVPYAEQLLSSYLAKEAGATLGELLTSVADPSMSDLLVSDSGVMGQAQQVPHVAVASQLWVEAQDGKSGQHALVLLEVRGVEARAGQNLAREPRDALRITAAPVSFQVPIADRHSPLLWLGALVRATQMAAFAERVLAASLEHAKTRVQFGRPIASFQAVQQELAVLGCEVAALNAAVDSAAALVDQAGLAHIELALEAIAAAKIQAGVTARRAAEIGHAVHAAVGFTQEHSLHRYTQRLLSYRAEFGAERVFARMLGARARASGADSLWSHLVSEASPRLAPPSSQESAP